MRVIFIPNSNEEIAIIVGVIVLVLGIAVVVSFYKRLFPSTISRLASDMRYRQALGVYVGNLQSEDPTREERRAAVIEAISYLVNDHGIPSAEASTNMRLVVATFDHDQSLALRQEGAAHEEAGDYASARAYYERAARLQEEHDPADHGFLLQCIARVSARIRT